MKIVIDKKNCGKNEWEDIVQYLKDNEVDFEMC